MKCSSSTTLYSLQETIDHGLQSPALQSVMELLATKDLLLDEYKRRSSLEAKTVVDKEEKEQADEQNIDISRLNVLTLDVKKAVYGDLR